MIKVSDNVAEIIPNRLYWVSSSGKLSGIKNAFSFSIDEQLIYSPFFSDFGPLNIGSIYKYIKDLDKMMKEPSFSNSIIIHHTSLNSGKRSNAALLMAAY